MKAVVTGASGYLGFHLVSELLAAGHTVYAVCNRSRGFLDELEQPCGLTVIESEIPKIEEKLNGVVPDVFYHLAWQGALGEQRVDASLQISNEILAIEAMKACSRMGCPKIIFTGTVYEKLAEEMLMSDGFSGSSFYCIAKKHANDMIRQLSKKLALNYIWVQFCHPVGRFMNQNQLFPYAVNAFRNNRPTEFGNCRNYFDIVSVRYLSKGLCILGEREVPKKTYYIGSGYARILREYLQIAADHFEALLPEVMEGEARGDFEGAPDTEERYKYEHLQAVFLNRDKMENGDELYKKMYQTAMETCDRHLKEKFARQEVINVAFMSYSAAQWPAEMLYRDMENDPRFNPYIIVSPLMNRDEESRISGYNQTLLWYYNNGYKVYGGVGDTYLSWEDLGGIPDLVVHLSSWYECIPDPQQYLTLPWKCANIYIPYGIEVGDNQDRTYAVKNVFNKDIMNMLWRLYTDSKMTLQSYQKYGLIQGVNVRYSGYLKMDELVKPRTFTKQEITGLWKCPGDISKFRKIIIAPHYTVGNEGEFISSTFRQNVWFWLYLAEKYRDSVSFLFKPHPNLRGSAVQQGLFSSYEEYDRYFAAWNELPNARAIDESKYIDYFLTSDAMILDSSSFIGEYLYVQKPVLYLTRPEQGFTDLGEAVVNTYYRAPGWDLMEIERFITDVVLEGKDPLKNEREKVFEEYLDYYRLNGKMSHEIIFDDIVSSMEA